jgi:cytoskeletal protein CcmA (bactofilin family)
VFQFIPSNFLEGSMHRSPRSTLLVLALTLVLAFGLTTPAAAQSLIYGSTIPAGTTVDQDVFLVGQNVSIDGTVNGNVFILGNQVVVNGTVDGSLVLVGQNAAIGGTVSGEVYAAALTLDLGPNAALGRDLYAGTVSLTSGKGSVIGRDLYAVGLDSGLSGHIGRDLHTAVGPLQLYNGVMRLLGFDNLTIKLHFEAPAPQSGGSGSAPQSGHRALLRQAGKAARPFDWAGWGLDVLRSWMVLFALGVLAAWLLRRPLKLARGQVETRPVRAAAVGLLVLVFAFAAIGAALLLVVLIFVLGLGLNYLGLWQLSLGIWALAYSALALALAVLWFLVVYGTKIIVAYAASTWLSGRLFRRRAFWIDVLALLAGTLVFVLLQAIPYAGWIFGVLVTAAGAGAAWMAWQWSRQKPSETTVPVPTVTIRKQPARPGPAKKTGKS